MNLNFNSKHGTIFKHLLTLICCIASIATAYSIHGIASKHKSTNSIRVGFVYVGDLSDAYTSSFTKAQRELENRYGEQVETVSKYNIPYESVKDVLTELADANCSLIFTTSYGYGETTKAFAAEHPDIQFCQATCSNANEAPVLSNYHTFMGYIYEGRYISGVVAGMKLNELIENGTISSEQAKIGYVGAFPYPEVISGYTAFLLGVRSVVPNAVITVKYTNSWGNYRLEKLCAEELIDEGCVIISQHSDTAGPAVACEETDRAQVVYYVSYNKSMRDIAPTTYLTGSKINWAPYLIGATDAVLSNKNIESCVKGNIHGNDTGSGFENAWVGMLELNDFVVANGTQQKVDELITKFSQDKMCIFSGNYVGVDPFDPTDTIDLNIGYNENEESSAPTFHYILQDVVTVE